jgi:hypothetical protein
MLKIESGVVDKQLYFVGVDATDLKTFETGLATWTVYRTRNGAAEVAWTTPTIAEIDATNAPGLYALLVDEDTTISYGVMEEEVSVRITHAGMAPVTSAYVITCPLGRKRRGTAGGVAAQAITLASESAPGLDYFKGDTVEIVSATTGAGQWNTCTTSTNADPPVLTMAQAWPVALTGTVVYRIWGAGALGSTAAEIASQVLTDSVGTPIKADAVAVSGDTAAADELEAMFEATIAEIGAVPAANAKMIDKLRWMFLQSRNKITQTATTQLVKADDGSTTVGTSTVSDDGTTFTRGEFA